MRGATKSLSSTHHYLPNFNPRSSCEERHALRLRRLYTQHISIHAPHARSDGEHRHGAACHPISIHAPHARSDKIFPCRLISKRRFQSTLLMRGATLAIPTITETQYISIHAPHARSDLDNAVFILRRREFQSTLLMRGATTDCGIRFIHTTISIHAPHARSDARCRGRCYQYHISIHAPHARSDTSLL